jgi:hypothetical protein
MTCEYVRRTVDEQTDDARDADIAEVPVENLPKKSEMGGVEVRDEVSELVAVKRLWGGAWVWGTESGSLEPNCSLGAAWENTGGKELAGGEADNSSHVSGAAGIAALELPPELHELSWSTPWKDSAIGFMSSPCVARSIFEGRGTHPLVWIRSNSCIWANQPLVPLLECMERRVEVSSGVGPSWFDVSRQHGK